MIEDNARDITGAVLEKFKKSVFFLKKLLQNLLAEWS